MAVWDVLDRVDVRVFEGTFLLALCLLLFSIPCSFWVCIVLLLFMYACLVVIRKRKRVFLESNGKAVLITGCDTGFGHHLAKRLDDHGFDVFAGVLSTSSEGANSLRSRKSKRLHVLQLDITSQDEVDKAVKDIESKFGNKGLWGVVNNAGFNIYGDVELATIEQYKKCMDVNLYGMIRVTKACLPLIRKCKGRVVNISSVKGRYAWPSDSVYHVSKYGVETLTDSLRLEMRKFGVGVSVVAPGAFDAATSCSGPISLARMKNELEASWSAASEDVRMAYGRAHVDALYECLATKSLPGSATSPDPILDAIEDALINTHPIPRYVVGGSSSGIVDPLAVFAHVYSFLPEWFSDFLLARMTGCDKRHAYDKVKKN
ncbi:D-beta-hydroxybutyrate dehydrogenase, mitochondrial-like [Mizuhopecten yessoensis]|uniref:Bifunctional ATP-dependent dihydroxyacetone kinase/FAD-AMP lyase (Cyclizing) n=1 Tax=Mizuhopecten yessoensis TaxID=6573 RepID=A0A210QXI2_MIZYE|nr:D-beta-hydroxybutyrate dehydrogenase, mitochondrial-like [Mizuhopecten yessoensis]OWF53402.1 Bifunctional ATP-dependent dihydroxyacetone kinase/FAD-AMP lyase (cyclizing) [Mizuhopecten yessoensis]